MFKLIIEEHEPKKISVEEYKKYLSMKKSVRGFEEVKSHLKEDQSVLQAINNLRSLIRSYRMGLRSCGIKYSIAYTPEKKSWAKLIPSITHSFVRNSFYDPAIENNKKHIHYHKALFANDVSNKAAKIRSLQVEIRDKIKAKKEEIRRLRREEKVQTIPNYPDPIHYWKVGAAVFRPVKKTFGRGESPRGFIDERMGVYMRFTKSKDRHKIFEPKNPKTADNYVGIEIEFGCDLGDEELSMELLEEGLQNYVHLKRDGSVKAGKYPHELCLLAREKDIFELITKVTKVLTRTNAVVNKTCGLHVHLDMRHRNPDNAFMNLVCSQNVLYAMNPLSRAAGTYCRRMDTKDFQVARTAPHHYWGINAEAHRRLQTIEVRIHSGTISNRKIANWVKLLLLIVNQKTVIKNAIDSLRDFVSAFGIDTELAMYIAERMDKFDNGKKDLEEKGAA